MVFLNFIVVQMKNTEGKMNKLSSKNMHLVTKDNKLVIFYCFEDFRKWYLQLHDFSMFSEADIQTMINEEKPEYYPCAPLIIDAYHGIYYLNTKNIRIKLL